MYTIAGSYSNNMSHFVRNSQSCITLHSHQGKKKRVCIPPRPCQHFVLWLWSLTFHAMYVVYLTFVLIWNSLVPCAVEHLFMWSVDNYIASSLIRCLFRLYPFFNQILHFILIELLRVLCIFWVTVLYQMCPSQLYLSQSMTFSFSWEFVFSISIDFFLFVSFCPSSLSLKWDHGRKIS